MPKLCNKPLTIAAKLYPSRHLPVQKLTTETREQGVKHVQS